MTTLLAPVDIGCRLWAMKLGRLLPIAALVLMAINATGVLRAAHMIEHHTPSAHACSGGEQSPNNQPTPAPSDDEHDCDLCLSLRSMHEIVPQLPVVVVALDLVSPTIPQPVIVVRAHARPAVHPARGPPVC
ncbi:MAG: hypothetical protein KC996_09560 [Phycisphaerales bacterium]|nr:hypothetical protein [Phycisphaerales bacterium]